MPQRIIDRSIAPRDAAPVKSDGRRNGRETTDDAREN
jgi:hypothetical protein